MERRNLLRSVRWYRHQYRSIIHLKGQLFEEEKKIVQLTEVLNPPVGIYLVTMDAGLPTGGPVTHAKAFPRIHWTAFESYFLIAYTLDKNQSFLHLKKKEASEKCVYLNNKQLDDNTMKLARILLFISYIFQQAEFLYIIYIYIYTCSYYKNILQYSCPSCANVDGRKSKCILIFPKG